MVLNILCWVVFTQTIRYAQRRQVRDYVVGAVNYVLAAVVCLITLAVLTNLRGAPPLLPAATLGAACGASYFGQFLLILLAYRLAGVGITMALVSMGVLVPVLLSWCFWSEPMTAWRWVAVALLPAAMVLVRPVRHGTGRLSFKADAVLLAVFLNNGLMGAFHKAVTIYAAANPTPEPFLFFQPYQLVYEASLFLVAALCSVSYAVYRGGRCGGAEMALGSIVGVSNVFGTLFTVVALSLVAAAVFFPTVTCALVVLSVILSRILWGERVSPRQVAGLGVALCIVVLVNL